MSRKGGGAGWGGGRRVGWGELEWDGRSRMDARNHLGGGARLSSRTCDSWCESMRMQPCECDCACESRDRVNATPPRAQNSLGGSGRLSSRTCDSSSWTAPRTGATRSPSESSPTPSRSRLSHTTFPTHDPTRRRHLARSLRLRRRLRGSAFLTPHSLLTTPHSAATSHSEPSPTPSRSSLFSHTPTRRPSARLQA